jgi:ABC-type sugar transport system ATPase subunit
MATVTFESVRKRYGEAVIVAGLDLSIADGELVVLVGGSGCGKSTILRMLAGLEQVTSGKILIGERDVTHLAPRDRNVAMVFQDYALYPHLTAYENLALGLRIRKVPKAEIQKRVSWAASLLGLEELLQRKPRQMSGGQRQRVAMGRAMVREPAVFLFDEPLSNLDAKLRGQMRVEICRLQRRLGVTTLYVTHDQVEAMTLGDRLVVLDGGRIQQVGRPIDLYRAPGNRFVAGFIGSPSMNFVEGRLASSGDELSFVADDLRVPLPAERRPDAALPDEAGKETVTMGIRPEDLTLAPPAPTSPTATGQLALAERLGSTTFLHVDVGKTRLVATAASDLDFTPDETLTLAIDPARVHLFDATGLSLLRSPGGGGP